MVFVTTCESRYGGTVYDSVCFAVLLPPRSIFVEMRPPALGPCAPCYERPDTICLKKAIWELCAKKQKFESSKRLCNLKFKKSCQGRHGWHYGHYNPDSSFLSIKHRNHVIFRFKHFRTQASAFTPWQHVWCRDAPCGPNELLRRNESCLFPWIVRWSSMCLRF